MYAVIQDRTRQFTVHPGDEILCDLASELKPGDSVTFEHVQLLGLEGSVRVGKPFVEGALVRGEVLGTARGDKLVVFHFKRRKNVRRKKGHRQSFTRVRIQEIVS